LLNSAFNIGYGSTTSILDLAKMISSNIEFIAKREGEANITFADNTRARNTLDWRPQYDLESYLSLEINKS
jgi:nucleoside-diphosphate-sugar epimerase